MLNPTYLAASRHGVFYFRFPIPPLFHPERKQSSLRLSLNTRCPKQALQAGRALSYAGNRLLEYLGKQKMADYQLIRETLHEHFRRALDAHKQRMASEGALTAEHRTAVQNSHALAEDALAFSNYTFAGTDQELNSLIENYELPIQPDTKAYDLLRTEFLKSFRDYSAAVLKADSALDNYDFTTEQNMKPVLSRVKLSQEKKLADAIDTYCQEKLRLKQWREQIGKEHRSQFDLLLRYLGNEVKLDVSPEVAQDVKNMLLKLPKHAHQMPEYRKLTIHELIALELPANKRLSAVSVAKYLRTYSTFYDWCVKLKMAPENHFKALVDNIKKVATVRLPFDLTDTRRILEIAKQSKKPHIKWGIYLAFYTGARLNEIAQLDTKDVIQSEDIWCISINDDGENKRLKNQSSRRMVPLHSRLIELGFIDYVESRGGKGRLFPELSFHPKDGYGRNLGRWFNDALLRKQLDITNDALVFHSIRHTVAQQLRNNQVQTSTIQDILGHAHSELVNVVYATNLNKSVMQEAIETLRYSELAATLF